MIKLFPAVIILAAAGLRLLPHPANFTPIGAMALFGGTYLPKKYALVLPLLAMLISDFFLGFHSTMPWVYGSFILTVLLGFIIKKRTNSTNILLASLISSVLFYLITNFGVWVSTSLYPKTLEGVLQSFLMGIPFFRNTLLGDLLYNGLFFGSLALFKQLYIKLAHQSY